MFRIGARFVARFPLVARDAAETRRWHQSEACAARELLGRTRFATPEPVALGEPGVGYSMPWSAQTWLPGNVATHEGPSGSLPFAHDLAEFIHGVRATPTTGRTFSGEGRGGDLRTHDAWVGAVWYYAETNPVMSLMGKRTLERLMADASAT